MYGILAINKEDPTFGIELDCNIPGIKTAKFLYPRVVKAFYEDYEYADEFDVRIVAIVKVGSHGEIIEYEIIREEQ